MKTQQEKFMSGFGSAPVREDELTAFARSLQEIGETAGEVQSHLARYAAAEGNKTIKRQAEALKTWMDVNSEGLAVAAHAAALGPVWTEEVKHRLEAAAHDLRRLEEDIGERVDPETQPDILQVWNEINGVLESMEALYRPVMPDAAIPKVTDAPSALAS